MNILIIANSKPSIGSIELSLKRGFEGCEARIDLIYPESIISFSDHRNLIFRILQRIESLLKLKQLSLFYKLIGLKKNNYDFALAIKGSNLSPQSINKIKSWGIKIYGYNPDDPYNLKSSSANIIQCLPLYDTHFSWSKSLVKKIAEREGVKTFYLPFAADEELSFLETHSKQVKQYRYSISFIGNWDTERERQLNLVEKKSDLVLFGYNWAEKLKSKDLISSYSGIEVPPDKLRNFVSDSLINLNFLRMQNKGSNNMRTFEILASGGMLLHEYSDEVALYFDEGVEIEFFRSKEELNNKISYYLDNPIEAERIAYNGKMKIISGKHTYKDRAKRIIQIHTNEC